jgi:hypothetical protein
MKRSWSKEMRTRPIESEKRRRRQKENNVSKVLGSAEKEGKRQPEVTTHFE